jgi:hypothetical protein
VPEKLPMVLWVEEDFLPEHMQVKPSAGEATTNMDVLTPSMVLWVEEDLLFPYEYLSTFR